MINGTVPHQPNALARVLDILGLHHVLVVLNQVHVHVGHQLLAAQFVVVECCVPKVDIVLGNLRYSIVPLQFGQIVQKAQATVSGQSTWAVVTSDESTQSDSMQVFPSIGQQFGAYGVAVDGTVQFGQRDGQSLGGEFVLRLAIGRVPFPVGTEKLFVLDVLYVAER